ncbi:MAG: inositol monophosphatase [Candidatus Levybacteria bacterium]|nr:inositol monophosphatase [Candidatus Levybacteria bacterium]
MSKEDRKNMANSIELTEARKYLVDLVPQAGETLKRYFASRDFTQRNKDGVDFTTQADEEVDAFLIEQIKKQYPQTNFLTEETAPADYSSLEDTSDLWVIDPLDGTINFSRKHPHFAISIGLVDKGVPKLGVVHIPMTGDTYWAQADQEGAFLNGEPIRVSPTDNLGESVVACDWAWGLEKRLNVVRWLNNVSTHIRQIKSMGSAVADLASLASGRIDAYMHSGLKPWDVAASALLIEKAGGKITTPTGDPWNVFNSDILASNGILHERLLNLLNINSNS